MFYGWRVVGGTFLSQMFVMGFFTYAVSLLVAPVREEFGVSLEQVMYSLTAGTFFGLLMTPLAGVMADRFNVRWLMAAGALLYAAGMWTLSHSGSVTGFVLVFGVTMAVANAFAGALCSSAAISRWFTVSRGRALGVAATGTSVGGVIIPYLVNTWLQSGGWRVALENYSLCLLLVMVPAIAVLVRGKPEDVGLQAEHDPQPPAEDSNHFRVLTVTDILRMPYFWYIGLSLGLLFCVYSSILSNITPWATDLGATGNQASALIMAVAIGGFIGKILFGIAADKISLRVGLWLAQVLVMTGFLVMAASPPFAGMLLATSLLGLAAGGMLPVWGAMMAAVFGLVSYGRAMGLMGPMLTLCVMPGFTVVGRLYDSTGSYTLSLLLFTGVTLLAALLLLPVKIRHH